MRIPAKAICILAAVPYIYGKMLAETKNWTECRGNEALRDLFQGTSVTQQTLP